MNKYSYYTPVELADEIIKLLPKKKYNTIIDICCGTWNLLSAAQKKYSTAEVQGVDVDESSEVHMLPGAKFALEDGRAFAEKEKNAKRTYDLILSNPPFGGLSDSDIYWNKRTGDARFSSLMCRRYEAEMMLANIFLAHEKSVLVFILPITFLKGESFRKARQQIAKEFAVLEIVELPINTFPMNKLRTVAIIMEKTRNTKIKTNYRRATYVDDKWNLNQIGQISSRIVKTGNWIGEGGIKTDIIIKRGNIHSGEMHSGDNEVLHCSSWYENGQWRPAIRHTNQTPKVRAERGDIIINRIGKGAGYWCINDRNNIGVSDCLFVVKNNEKNIIKKLCDNTVEGKLNINVRGVSTMYITQADICNIIKA